MWEGRDGNLQTFISLYFNFRGRRDGAVVIVFASHQVRFPGPGVTWVECVVASRPCFRSFFSGFSSFPLSTKTNTPNSNLIMSATGLSALLLKEQCHKDFAILGQFYAKIITLRL